MHYSVSHSELANLAQMFKWNSNNPSPKSMKEKVLFLIALQVICWKSPARTWNTRAICSIPTNAKPQWPISGKCYSWTQDTSVEKPGSFSLPEPHCCAGEKHDALHYPALVIQIYSTANRFQIQLDFVNFLWNQQKLLASSNAFII